MITAYKGVVKNGDSYESCVIDAYGFTLEYNIGQFTFAPKNTIGIITNIELKPLLRFGQIDRDLSKEGSFKSGFIARNYNLKSTSRFRILEVIGRGKPIYLHRFEGKFRGSYLSKLRTEIKQRGVMSVLQSMNRWREDEILPFWQVPVAFPVVKVVREIPLTEAVEIAKQPSKYE